MNCEVLIDAWMEAKENGTIVNIEVQKHIDSCTDCAAKIQQIEWLEAAMLSEPKAEPPQAIRNNFEAFLAKLKSSSPDTDTVDASSASKLRDSKAFLRTVDTRSDSPTLLFKKLSTQVWLAAGLILILGVAILLVLVLRKDPQVEPAIAVHSTDSINAFASNSAFDRIQAINNANYKSSQRQELLKTLGNILLNDKNANVRMAALYGLASYISDPTVFDVILQALKTEKDPALQILLITTLGQKNSQKSQDAIQSIIDNSAVQKDVRSVAEQILKTL